MPSETDRPSADPPPPPASASVVQRPTDAVAFDWRSADERMLRRARGAVVRVCRVSQAIASDAATDALIRLIAKGEQPRDPQRLLNQVAVNLALDAIRRNGRVAEPQQKWPDPRKEHADAENGSHAAVSTEPGPDEQLHQALVRARVRDALDRLPALDRSVLRAVYFDGAEPSDLDRGAGVAPGTHKARLHRARERLRSDGKLIDL